MLDAGFIGTLRREWGELVLFCGAVLTLVSNIQTVIELAHWIRWALANWLSLVTWFWTNVLFFVPRLSPFDAAILTVICFLTGNVVRAGFRPEHERGNGVLPLVLLSGLTLGALYIFADGVTSAFIESVGAYQVETAPGTNDIIAMWFNYRDIAERSLIGGIFADLFPGGYACSMTQDQSHCSRDELTLKLLTFTILVCVAGIVALAALFSIVARSFGYRWNTSAAAMRMFSILLGVAGVLALNELSKLIETFVFPV